MLKTPTTRGKRKNLIDIIHKWEAVPQKVLFLIGPEGDFTEEELNYALKAGSIPVSLGERVLKVDTAAITVIATTNLFLKV